MKLNDTEVNDYEHVFLTIPTSCSASSYDVIVPKFTPLSLGPTKVEMPIPIITSGYLNASAYKTDVSPVVTKKNWINIKQRFYIPPS